MSILQRIVSDKKEELASAKLRLSLKELIDRCQKLPPPLSFTKSLRNTQKAAIIAEVKKASPSKGVLSANLSPNVVAVSYARNGARAISILTESKYFQGSLLDLAEVRKALPETPLLRKDFITDDYQVWETRAWGADALLLIVATLDWENLLSLTLLARQLGLEVLVEIHDELELDVYLKLLLSIQADPMEQPPLTTNAINNTWPLLGINNRNLHTFVTDLAVTERLIQYLQDSLTKMKRLDLLPQITCVSESGIKEPGDLCRLAKAGAQAFLVGESLVTTPDPGAALARLIS